MYNHVTICNYKPLKVKCPKMSVNLKKNEQSMLAAFKDVVNDKTDTDW